MINRLLSLLRLACCYQIQSYSANCKPKYFSDLVKIYILATGRKCY